MLEKLIKTTTVFGSFIILNGIIYILYYYHYFGIDVFSYLTFTEIITCFLDNILIIFKFFLIYLVHIAFSLKLIETIEEKLKNKRFFELILKSASIGLLIQIIISVIIAILISLNKLSINRFLIYFFTFTILNVIHYLFDKLETVLKKVVGEKTYGLIFILLIIGLPFLFYSISFSQYSAWQTSKNPKNISIIEDSGILNLDSSFKYIGKTNNYVFLHDFERNENISISLKNVKIIKLSD